jgi:hypothetical protein
MVTMMGTNIHTDSHTHTHTQNKTKKQHQPKQPKSFCIEEEEEGRFQSHKKGDEHHKSTISP